MIEAIKYNSNGKLLTLPLTDAEHRGIFGNALCTMIQYCLIRPKLMKYIRNHTEIDEQYKNEMLYQEITKVFPIVQEAEVGTAVQFFAKIDEPQYRKFLEKNLKRVFNEYRRSEQFKTEFVVQNALDFNKDIYASVPIIAFSIWLVYVNASNDDFAIRFEDSEFPKLIILNMIETFGYYANMEKEAPLIKAKKHKYKIPFHVTQDDLLNTDSVSGELSLFNHVISALTKPARSYDKQKLSISAINIINNHFDYYWEQLSDTHNDEVYHALKYAIASISPLIDDYNYLQKRYIGDTAPHEYIADKLSKKLTAADKETARLQDEIARLQEKLDEANKANAQLAKLQEKVSWLEDENRFLQDRISESQIIYAPQETQQDIQAFIDRMNTHKIGLVGGNDDWQSKVSAVFNVHTAVTEMNKVDSLKNCDIVIVNTAFISHSMYFAVQKTAQNALFMYIDNLNMDTIATLLYHKYSKSVL